MRPTVDIDSHSGFCFGVTSAIRKAEEELALGNELFCLGDIVHNSAEVQRLQNQGLKTINQSDFERLQNTRVLLRAHGEPPRTYQIAQKRNITVVDATCPVVLKLQQRIKNDYDKATESGSDMQIVIYGQPGHAEVNGLVGQTDGTAIVIEGPEQITKIDLNKDIVLYSQTTKSVEGFNKIIEEINRLKSPSASFRFHNTICQHVATRISRLEKFAAEHDVVVFVADKKSSNGKVLFNHCHNINPRTYLIYKSEEISETWLQGAGSIGICGATSTPRWLMEDVAAYVRNITGPKEINE